MEEGPDDDMIRFDMGGTEYFRMDSGRLEVVNTGSSVFLGEGAGAHDNLSNNLKVFIGFQAEYDNLASKANTGIGYQSLRSIHSAYWNTATGFGALKLNKLMTVRI